MLREAENILLQGPGEGPLRGFQGHLWWAISRDSDTRMSKRELSTTLNDAELLRSKFNTR